MLDRQRLVWSRQAEKLNVAYVSFGASHPSAKLTFKCVRQVRKELWIRTFLAVSRLFLVCAVSKSLV